MSEKLKIKLSVANRVYPLTIHPSQEEGLRKASQEINNMIKQFEEKSFISKNQKTVILGDKTLDRSDFRYNGWLNNKDFKNWGELNSKL